MFQESPRNSAQVSEEPDTYRQAVGTNMTNSKKIDQCYYNSYMQVVKTYWRCVIYNIIKIIFVTVCIFYFFQSSHLHVEYIVPLFISIFISLLYMKTYKSGLNWLNDLENTFALADTLGHTGDELQQITLQQLNKKRKSNQKLTIQTIRSNTIYNYQEMHERRPSQSAKKDLEKVLVSRIEHEIKNSNKITRIQTYLYDLVSIALILYFIIKINITPVDNIYKNLLTTYIVVEIFAKFIQIVFLILVSLFIPIVIFIIIVYCIIRLISCKKASPPLELKTQKYSDRFKLDQPKCTICLQWFADEQDVIPLPCSQSHIFHKFCLDNWFKLSNKCPLCRKQIFNNQDNLNINNPQP